MVKLHNFTNIIIVSFFYASYGYRRVEEPVAFNDADAKCQEIYGKNLASIHSDEDYSDIVDICGEKACYIGGKITDIVNKTWSWIDGSLWDYENWETSIDIQQGQGLRAGEKYTCIASPNYAQNESRIYACDGLQQFYPICNAPEVIGNNTSLSPSSAPTYFTPTIYYSIAPTLHPSTLPPSQIHPTSMNINTDKVQMSHEPLFWIFLVLFLIMTVVAVSFAVLYCRSKQSKMNQSQQDIDDKVDIVENNNANIPSQFSKHEDTVTISPPNNSTLQMVITPATMQYTHSGNETSALLEDMYGDAVRSQAQSPKIVNTVDLDVDGEDDEDDLKVPELEMNVTPTFDYDLEGRQLEDMSSNNVNGKHIVCTRNGAN